jgi:hypothetical protein
MSTREADAWVWLAMLATFIAVLVLMTWLGLYWSTRPY